MNKRASAYIGSVIAAGGLMLAYSLEKWYSPDPVSWLVYFALAMLASVLKLRLPGMEGTFSPGFLFLLYGIAHYSMAETLVAGCAAAIAGSILNSKRLPTPAQILFNAANVAFSAGLCYYLVRTWLPDSITKYEPVAVVVAACVYFVVNTLLVSGVLALLQGKRVGEVSLQWYFWSFPYYLVGVALVGLIPSFGRPAGGEAWLILLPLLYLLHFFLGLARSKPAAVSAGAGLDAPLPGAAQRFITVVSFLGALAVFAGAETFSCSQPVRFAGFLSLGVLASTLKIRLPGVRGTMSPGFVLLLAAIPALSFGEVVLIAAVMGVVQVTWRPSRPVVAIQILFSSANLALCAGITYTLCRVILAPFLANSIAGQLAVSTVVLYGLGSLSVATVLALVESRPLRTVWQVCYFWSLPYYMVGAAVAGLMIAAAHTADWPASLLILPVMSLVYVSYGAHVQRAVSVESTAV